MFSKERVFHGVDMFSLHPSSEWLMAQCRHVKNHPGSSSPDPAVSELEPLAFGASERLHTAPEKTRGKN